jgi:hypothetical protein
MRSKRWNAPPPAPADRFGDKCHSAPFCDESHLPGERFCAEHQAILNRVRAALNPHAKRRSPTIAGLKVSHVEPKPARVTREEYRRLILAALASGSRTSAELAAACGTDCDSKTCARARIELERARSIICIGREGRQMRYAIAAAAA